MQLQSLSASASLAMTPFMLSLNLGNATEAEKEIAKSWQSYYRALQAVDISAEEPNWPSPPIT